MTPRARQPAWMPPNRRHRRGTVYVAVVAASLLVAVLGVTAVIAVRLRANAAALDNDTAEARLYAQSAVEMGLARVQTYDDWRTRFPNGEWASDVAIGAGTMDLSGEDPADGDLTDDEMDALVLTGTGRKGRAVHRVRVTVAAERKGLDCLRSALHAHNDIDFASGATVTCDGVISSNDDVDASSASIGGDVEAVDNIRGSTYHGETTEGIAPRQMPDSSVFDDYLANGTWINIRDVDEFSTNKHRIYHQVLSAGYNPFGSGQTNAEGIYVIDCEGRHIRVRKSRINATLVLLNPRWDSRVTAYNHWEPAVANYPALLVDGEMIFSMSETLMSEATEGVNFNPAGAPYEGETDDEQDDVYPCTIKGLVYVRDKMKLYTSYVPFDGAAVCGGPITSQSGVEVDLKYRSIYYDDPPPGFRGPVVMKVQSGTWAQVVDD